jgi:hypothetical protein
MFSAPYARQRSFPFNFVYYYYGRLEPSLHLLTPNSGHIV